MADAGVIPVVQNQQQRDYQVASTSTQQQQAQQNSSPSYTAQELRGLGNALEFKERQIAIRAGTISKLSRQIAERQKLGKNYSAQQSRLEELQRLQEEAIKDYQEFRSNTVGENNYKAALKAAPKNYRTDLINAGSSGPKPPPVPSIYDRDPTTTVKGSVSGIKYSQPGSITGGGKTSPTGTAASYQELSSRATQVNGAFQPTPAGAYVPTQGPLQGQQVIIQEGKKAQTAGELIKELEGGPFTPGRLQGALNNNPNLVFGVREGSNLNLGPNAVVLTDQEGKELYKTQNVFLPEERPGIIQALERGRENVRSDDGSRSRGTALSDAGSVGAVAPVQQIQLGESILTDAAERYKRQTKAIDEFLYPSGKASILSGKGIAQIPLGVISFGAKSLVGAGAGAQALLGEPILRVENLISGQGQKNVERTREQYLTSGFLPVKVVTSIPGQLTTGAGVGELGGAILTGSLLSRGASVSRITVKPVSGAVGETTLVEGSLSGTAITRSAATVELRSGPLGLVRRIEQVPVETNIVFQGQRVFPKSQYYGVRVETQTAIPTSKGTVYSQGDFGGIYNVKTNVLALRNAQGDLFFAQGGKSTPAFSDSVTLTQQAPSRFVNLETNQAGIAQVTSTGSTKQLLQAQAIQDVSFSLRPQVATTAAEVPFSPNVQLIKPGATVFAQPTKRVVVESESLLAKRSTGGADAELFRGGFQNLERFGLFKNPELKKLPLEGETLLQSRRGSLNTPVGQGVVTEIKPRPVPSGVSERLPAPIDFTGLPVSKISNPRNVNALSIFGLSRDEEQVQPAALSKRADVREQASFRYASVPLQESFPQTVDTTATSLERTTSQGSDSAFRFDSAAIQEPATEQETFTLVRNIPRTNFSTPNQQFSTPFEEPFLTSPSSGSTKKKKKSLYDVELRRFGKFYRVNNQGLPLTEAFDLGQTITDKTLAASFKITDRDNRFGFEEMGGIKDAFPTQIDSEKFGLSKRDKNVIVEKPSQRLSAISERTEIQQARKNVFGNTKKSIFGG